MALRKRVEPFSREIKFDESLFESLASAICSQQLSLKAAATIHSRFKALFKNQKPEAEAALKLTHAELRAVGLSEAKAKAIRDLSEKTISGIVPDDNLAMKLTDTELIERLTQVRGIGKWTVEMILIFRYKRPDVWPVDDLGVQKGFRLLFPELKFKTAKDLQPLADFWAGNRSELAWYCWRAIEELEVQTLTAVPLAWQQRKLLLWLQGDKIIRLDFSRSEKKPKPIWPGVIKTSKTETKKWQKILEHSLKAGVSAEHLQLTGTPFQQQVWAAIATITWGKTKTYQEIAEMLGNPKGVRAVAGACGANPTPLLIPCHRVVGVGNLGGFSGGLPLKRMLLAAEKR